MNNVTSFNRYRHVRETLRSRCHAMGLGHTTIKLLLRRATRRLAQGWQPAAVLGVIMATAYTLAGTNYGH